MNKPFTVKVTYVYHWQSIKCHSYQLAVQSLCSDAKLHTRFDRTRHEGKNMMDYTQPEPETPHKSEDDNHSEDDDHSDMDLDTASDDSDSEISSEAEDFSESPEGLESESEGSEDDYSDTCLSDREDEINDEAYDARQLEKNGLQRSEQAGVLHLVHGWIQQAQPEKVSLV